MIMVSWVHFKALPLLFLCIEEQKWSIVYYEHRVFVLFLLMQSLQRPRDKGRFIPGQLIRGSSEPRLTPASIPSKAKITILYKDSDTAFGSASLRFSRSSDIKVGPGEYNLNINPENPSYSKKGFGPLISKWSNSDRVFRNRGPGPSDYKGR